jgi:hypothetical protein
MSTAKKAAKKGAAKKAAPKNSRPPAAPRTRRSRLPSQPEIAHRFIPDLNLANLSENEVHQFINLLYKSTDKRRERHGDHAAKSVTVPLRPELHNNSSIEDAIRREELERRRTSEAYAYQDRQGMVQEVRNNTSVLAENKIDHSETDTRFGELTALVFKNLNQGRGLRAITGQIETLLEERLSIEIVEKDAGPVKAEAAQKPLAMLQELLTHHDNVGTRLDKVYGYLKKLL